MKQKYKRALSLGTAMVLSLNITAAALAAGPAPACDETYYATLDYYGGLKDSSVVKSYRTNGNTVLNDFGKYDAVTNLTDSRTASISGEKVTFDLSDSIPNKFYFEGKTSQPYMDFPWKLSLSYALNGVPQKAEDLAGKSGVAEITLDAVPNPDASEYSRNNLVLTAVSMFNGGDILSLDAPGAQVQMVGNMYCVVYMVLPGEEQHFTIRAGSEDFSYNGMILLAVPATLQQLEQVADLRDAKETAEDSYHAIDDSMSAILDAMDGMSGHLNAAASGLDVLNTARGTISGGKGTVYSSVDLALAAVEELTKSLEPITGILTPVEEPAGDGEASPDGETVPEDDEPELPEEPENSENPEKPEDPENSENLEKPENPENSENPENPDDFNSQIHTDTLDAPDSPAHIDNDGEAGEEEIVTDLTTGHLATAQRALAESTRLMNQMNQNVSGLRPEVENMRVILRQLQGDLWDLQDDLQELRDRLDEAREDSNDLNDICKSLTRDMENMSKSLDRLRIALGGTKRISSVDKITVNGMSTTEIRDAADKASGLHGMYEASGFEGSFKDFLVGGAGLDDKTAGQLDSLYDQSQSPGFSDKLDQADSANSMISGVNDKIEEINRLIDDLAQPAAVVIGDLEDTVDDLARLSRLMEDLTEDTGDGSYDTLDTLDHTLDTLSSAIDLTVRVSSNVDTAIEQLDSLTGIVNTYEPELQQALTDTYHFTTAASISLSALANAGKSTENLLQSAGPGLDSGTRQSLSSVAAALRKSTDGLEQTDTIRGALDVINDLITDQWDSHTGEDNNILFMNALAAPESITDARNENVASIQYVIRTQEIKEAGEEEAGTPAAAAADRGSLWTRIKKMFQDIWTAITGVF
ncbi:MAG: hypothetical protein K2O18_07385 [Oscillospiraceae bacterium]|nr:hypothetical protein [Oscillospiraceae bacterium]